MPDDKKLDGPSNEPEGGEDNQDPKPGEGGDPKPQDPKPGEGGDPKPQDPKPGEGDGEPQDSKPGEGGEPKTGEDGEPDPDEGGEPEGDDLKPDKAEDYSFAKVLPKDVPEDSPLVSEFKKSAFEHGLTQGQAEAMIKFYGEAQNGELVARGRLIEQGLEILRQDWGGDFDTRMKRAEKAALKFGGPDFLEELKADPLGVSPNMARFLDRVGQAISEDTFVEGVKDKTSKAEQADDEIYGDIE